VERRAGSRPSSICRIESDGFLADQLRFGRNVGLRLGTVSRCAHRREAMVDRVKSEMLEAYKRRIDTMERGLSD